MIALAYYLLKVIICSGVLFLYYHLALRNKVFHQWNRAYLLFAVALSLLLPIIQLNLFASTQEGTAIKLIRVVESADIYIDNMSAGGSSRFGIEQLALVLYIGISVALFLSLIYSVFKIIQLVKTHSSQWLENIRFVMTNTPGTPFSFLHYIFWNQNIDPSSSTGQQIFQHELVHVQEKHTLDKLFIQIVLAVFWCNPFFWLIRKELSFIHEFIADKKAVANYDAASLAAMILQASYPEQFGQLISPFFQTTIKRRIAMLTKIQNPKRAYISRVIALPLIAFMAFAFTVRTKNNSIPIVTLQKEFVVVIDAGHGLENGKHTGAVAGNVYEDDINLSLAQKIKELNTNNHVRIVLSRADNNSLSLQDRVAFAKKEKADLFVSVHVNADADNIPAETGFQIYVPSKNEKVAKQSNVAGSAFAEALSKVYKTNTSLLKRVANIFVLNEAPCAAILIECGSISNDKDKRFISNEENQKSIAKTMLMAIQRYAANAEKNYSTSATIFQKDKEIASVEVHKNKNNNELTMVYRDGSSEVLTEQEAQKKGFINNDYSLNRKPVNQPSHSGISIHADKIGDNTIYMLDGIEITHEDLSKLDPRRINSMNILKGNSAIIKYGDRGKDGVVEITLLANNQVQEHILEQAEIEATVNPEQWEAFLSEKLSPIVNDLAKKNEKGTYVVNLKFIVHKDGGLSHVTVINGKPFDFSERIVAMMADSPKWTPAEQNGKPVTSYHVQPIILKVQ